MATFLLGFLLGGNVSFIAMVLLAASKGGDDK